VDDASKTRGIIYLNVETSLLFGPPYQNFWLSAYVQGRTEFRWRLGKETNNMFVSRLKNVQI